MSLLNHRGTVSERGEERVSDDPDDGDPEADPESDDGEEEEDQDNEKDEATATDIVGVTFLPFAEEGEVAVVGFVESGSDDACTGDEVHDRVEQEVHAHLSEHKDGDAEANAFEENDKASGRSEEVTDAGEDGDDGVEADAEIGAWNADPVVEPLGEDAGDFGGFRCVGVEGTTRGGVVGGSWIQDFVDGDVFGWLLGHEARGLAFAGEVNEHLGVAGVAFEQADDTLESFDGLVTGEAAAEHVDFVELEALQKEFLAPGAGFEDVGGGVVHLLGDLAIEHEFHVAGAFEFLEDEIVHAATGLDESGGEDGEGTGFTGVACGGEEAARDFQGTDTDTTGHGGTALFGVVEGAGEAGDGVQQDEDMLTAFDEAFGAFDGELSDAGVALDVLIVGGGKDFRVGQDAFELGDFFWAFIDQKEHEVHAGVVDGDGLGDVLEERGFACARRGDNQAALAATDRSEHVDDAGGETIFVGLELDALVGVDGFEFFKEREVAHGFRNAAIDLGDLGHLLAALSFAGLAFDEHALAEAEFADQVGVDKRILSELGKGVGALAEEAVAF